MTVLRVIAELDAPVAASEPLHLDAMLLGVHPEMHGHPITRTTPIADLFWPWMPVASVSRHGARCFLSSAWDVGDGSPGLERLVSRRDAQDQEHLARPYSVASGPAKNVMLPVPTVEASVVSWLVVGRRRGVWGLLRYLRAIGAKRRHGFGVVGRWDLIESDEDPLRVLVDAEGRAARYLPLSWLAETPAYHDIGPVLPPYWHPGLNVPRARPGVPVTLRPEVVEAVSACH